jgi:hypothetical protein
MTASVHHFSRWSRPAMALALALLAASMVLFLDGLGMSLGLAPFHRVVLGLCVACLIAALLADAAALVLSLVGCHCGSEGFPWIVAPLDALVLAAPCAWIAFVLFLASDL